LCVKIGIYGSEFWIIVGSKHRIGRVIGNQGVFLIGESGQLKGIYLTGSEEFVGIKDIGTNGAFFLFAG